MNDEVPITPKPSAETRANMLVNRLPWSVKSAGTNVVLKIGNADIEFDYETAFEMSQSMRFAAKEAKLIAGDASRHWYTVGRVSDIQQNFEKFILPNLRYAARDIQKKITGGS